MSRRLTTESVSAAVAWLIAIVVVVVAPAARAAGQEKERVNANAKAIAEFQEEVAEYLDLHRKLEGTLPAVPKEATPEAIDEHQRALGRLIQQARRSTRAGDIFESDVRPVIRRLLYNLFTGPDGKKLRMAVMEENPGEAVKLVINGRYPDTIPLSSVPPQVIRVLPPLPEELEYRFIENSLILLDVRAHIIVDYMTGAVPR
jgi:hypothetical protein